MLVRRRELRLAKQEEMSAIREQLFNHRTFGPRLTEATARAEFEAVLEKQVDYLGRASGLSETQKKKLHAAGRGDIKRFFDRVAEARKKLPAIDDLRLPMAVINKETAPLAEERAALLAAKGPIFTRALPRTLTEDQRAAFEKDDRDRRAFRHRADVRWTAVLLARSLGLLDDQRRRLEAVLLKETRPPLKFDTLDYTLVMYQASRIPEDEIRPIFDDLQWRVMTQELAASRRYKLPLKNGGFLPEEMFGDGEDGTLPPIHLLEPPAIRSR